MVGGVGGAGYDIEQVFGEARGEVVVRLGRCSKRKGKLGEDLIERGSYNDTRRVMHGKSPAGTSR